MSISRRVFIGKCLRVAYTAWTPRLEPRIASADALAHLSAFIGHGRDDSKLPVDWALRADAWLTRSGVELSRSTLAEWIGAVGVALQPLVDAMRRELLARPVLHAAETPVEQLDPGAGKTKRAYLFAYRSAGDRPIVVFDYCTAAAAAASMPGDSSASGVVR